MHAIFTQLRRCLSPVWTVLRRFWFCWVVTLVSAVVKENYPFSNNPMYGRFDDETYVLYATNEKDEVLFFEEQFGQTAIRLKKMVKARVGRLKKDPAIKDHPVEEFYRMAGEEALKHFDEKRWVKGPVRMEYTTIKLWRKDLKLEDGKVTESARVIAQYTPPPKKS